MNTPPFLIATACALWAYQTGQWMIAAAAALAIEGARFVPVRWNVAQAHFNRLSDFCSVLVVVLAVYLYFTFGNPRAILLLFQWLPLALLPLALAQAWGNQRRVGYAAFVWNLRKDPDAGRHAINLGYPCVLAWLIAASAANARSPAFYAAIVAIAGWALWPARPARYAPALWVALLVTAGAAGYGAQLGLSRLQGWIEETVPEWLAGSGTRTDPYLSRSDLGHIGELKLDDTIVLRVKPGPQVQAPLLLHRSSYNGYFGSTWVARNAPLLARLPDAPARWTLDRAPAAAVAVVVHDYAPRGNPVLALPRGTIEVLGLTAPEIRRNALGSVQAELPPGHFSYTAVLGRNASVESAPDADDLTLPRPERALFERISDELGLPGMRPAAAVAAVRDYFGRGYAYSTYQPGGGRSRSSIADFVLRTHSGHCEYFATATALLLRAGGVPARYATGFSAQEYSSLEEAYIVRERHAHAWVRAWVDGQWIDVDTTPAVWAIAEAARASWWSGATDFWSWLRFRTSALLAGARGGENGAAFWTGIALLLAAWLGWRLYQQRRLLVVGAGRGITAVGPRAAPGGDSEFFRVEKELARRGYPRARGETVKSWLARIVSRLPTDTEKAMLDELATLHYRYRFDPAGLTRAERERLRAGAEGWLVRHAAR